MNYAMLAVLIISALILFVWSIRSRDGFRVLRRYPVREQLRITLPGPTRWKRHVAASDISMLAPIRRGFLRYYLCCVLPVLLLGVAAISLSYLEYDRAKSDLAETQRKIEMLRKH